MTDQTLAEVIESHEYEMRILNTRQAQQVAAVVLELLTSDRMREVVARWFLMPYGVGDAPVTDRDLATAALAAIRTELEGPSDE